MVDESRDAAFLRGVNHLVSIQGHEVVVAVLITSVLLHPVPEVFDTKHFAHVLSYKRATETQAISYDSRRTAQLLGLNNTVSHMNINHINPNILQFLGIRRRESLEVIAGAHS